MQTLSEMFAGTVGLLPEKVFIDDGTRQITYRAFDAASSRLANVLADHGVGKGVPVCLYLPNCAELAIGYHACLKLGAIFVPITSMGKEREILAISRRTEAPVLLTNDHGMAIALLAAAQVASLHSVLTYGQAADGAEDLKALLAVASDERRLEPCLPEDLAAVFFTSGTTGEPKGAMQTHGSVYSTVRDMAVFNRFRFGEEILLDVLPMFNNFGATCLMLAAVYSGATMIVHERWQTDQVLADIARHRVTYIAGTPTMLVYMWKAYRPEENDLSSLRLAIAGGAPIAAEVIDACERLLGIPRVSQIYGATEACGYVTGSPILGVQKRGSAGPAFGSARITVVDDDGKEVPAGTVGEFIIGGDTVGPGYWRDPETTASAYTAAGWVSGDLGYVDEDGYVYVVDRKKDLIICGGYNVYPVEVEDVMYRHPAVKVCAVVGVVDPVKGELPVAFVVPVETGSPELADELIAHCREHLSAYKAPRHIEFVAEMPLGPTGKILKRELRNWPVSMTLSTL